MKIQMKKEITIQTPAQKVWRILAHEFDKMGEWSSDLHDTRAIIEGFRPVGAKVCGRVCASHGFSGREEIEEVFTYYEEENMRFGYKGTKIPWFIKSAENNWSVRSLGKDRSVAEFLGKVELNAFLALLVKPYFEKLGRRVLEELKYYAEKDETHPRKNKALQKQVAVS